MKAIQCEKDLYIKERTDYNNDRTAAIFEATKELNKREFNLVIREKALEQERKRR